MSNLPHSPRLNYSGLIVASIVLLAFWILTTTVWAGHGPYSTGLYCSSDTEIWQDLYYTQEDLDNGANADEFHAPYDDCAQNNQTCESDGQGNAWCAETVPPPAGQCQQDRDFNEWIACNGAICGEGLFTCEGSDELRSTPHKPCQSYHPDYNPEACGLPPSQCQNDDDFNELIACNGAICGEGLYRCAGSDELRSKPADYCRSHETNSACEAPSVSPPEVEPPPEPQPPVPVPPTSVCGGDCTYSQGNVCYRGNCLNGSFNCGYNDNCGYVEGCSLPNNQTDCPDQVPIQEGTVVAVPIISSLTVSTNPPIAGDSIPDNTLITVTAHMANSTATRLEWFINGNKLEDQAGLSIEYRVKYDQTPQLTIKAIAYNNQGIASEPKQLNLVVQPSRLLVPPPEITALRITNTQTGAAINLDGTMIESGTQLKFEATIKSNDPNALADCRWYFHNEQSNSVPPPRQGGCNHVETFTEADSKVSLVPVHVYADQEVPGAERVINFTVKPPSSSQDVESTRKALSEKFGLNMQGVWDLEHLQWIYQSLSRYDQQTRFGARLRQLGSTTIQLDEFSIPEETAGPILMGTIRNPWVGGDKTRFITVLIHELGHRIHNRLDDSSSQRSAHLNAYGDPPTTYPISAYGGRSKFENYAEMIAYCLTGQTVSSTRQGGTDSYHHNWNRYIQVTEGVLGSCPRSI